MNLSNKLILQKAIEKAVLTILESGDHEYVYDDLYDDLIDDMTDAAVLVFEACMKSQIFAKENE